MSFFVDTNIPLGYTVIHDKFHDSSKNFIENNENIFWSNLVKKEYTEKLDDIIDDIEENWYDFDSYSNGMLEKAKDTEKPRFALILSDNDTSATGKTEIFYNCVCTSRPDIAGKTAEKGNWDDQFPVYKISATPRPKDGYVRFVKSGTAELTAVPEPTP